MAVKDGLNLSPRGIGIAIGVAALIATGAGLSGFGLSSGASTAATNDIRAVIESTIEDLDSTMTMDEAETWRAEQDRMRHVDDTLIKHGKALERVQQTVDGHTQMLQAIADEVGVNE